MKQLLAVAAAISMVGGQAPAPVTVIRAARMIAGTAGTMTGPAVVVIRGDRIASVGSTSQIPDGARIIDLGGATLLPGLIDLHTHLTSTNVHWEDELLKTTPGQAALHGAHNALVTLMAGHVERFNPAVQAIKNAIRGEDILSIAITRVGPFPPRMSNVGVVIDLAVHDIDLIGWFTDSKIIEVQPQVSSALAEREDIALLQFRTASGVLAHINTNWLTPFKARNVTVATRGKYVMGDLLTRQVTECFGFQADGSYSMRHLSVGHDEPLRAELISFIESARDGKPPAVTGEQAVASLEIAIRCLEGRSAEAVAPRRKGPQRIVAV